MLIHYPVEAEALIKISYHEIILLGGKDDVAESDKVTYYDLERKTWQDCIILINKQNISAVIILL